MTQNSVMKSGIHYLKVRLNRKADWRAVDSPKKRTDVLDLFAVKSKKANKTKSSIPFWEKLVKHKLLSRLADL